MWPSVKGHGADGGPETHSGGKTPYNHRREPWGHLLFIKGVRVTQNPVFQLTADIEAIIKRHRYESELTTAEYVGCLECIKHSILVESFDDTEEGRT